MQPRTMPKTPSAVRLNSSFLVDDAPVAAVVSGSLNAGRIIDAMERRARQAVDGIESFREVTILITHDDGSTASTTLHKEIQQDDEEYSATFFRNKIIKQTEEFRDDNCDGGKKGGDDDDDGGESPTMSPDAAGSGMCPARDYQMCVDDTQCDMLAGGRRLACECYCCCAPLMGDAEAFTECVEDTCRGYCEETDEMGTAAITCTYGGKKSYGGKRCDSESGSSKGSGSGGKKSSSSSGKGGSSSKGKGGKKGKRRLEDQGRLRGV